MKQRMLVLTQYYPPEVGAPQVRLASFVKNLVKLGWKVEIVTAMPNHPIGIIYDEYKGELFSTEYVNNIKVFRSWIYPATGAGIRRILNYLSFMITSFWCLLRANKPDYLFVESPPLFLGLTALLYCSIKKVPYILNIADLWPDSIKELGMIDEGVLYRLLCRFEGICYNKASYVNAVTIGIKEKLVDVKKVPPEKVLFLPNGVDREIFHPIPYDDDIASKVGIKNKKMILYSGTLGYAQGLDVGIRAFEILQARGSQAVLLLLGDGSCKKELMSLARVKKLNNIIFLAPCQPEFVASYLSVASAGLVMLKDLTLFKGARPSKIFPIMACGKPVIYCGFGEGANLVTESGAGIIVSPENPLELANAIENLIRDRVKCQRMGNNGIKYTKEHLNWEKITQEWVHSFEE